MLIWLKNCFAPKLLLRERIYPINKLCFIFQLVMANLKSDPLLLGLAMRNDQYHVISSFPSRCVSQFPDS